MGASQTSIDSAHTKPILRQRANPADTRPLRGLDGTAESAPRGTVADGFEPVRDEFATVAAEEGGDLSAQLVAYHHGKRVVDLWTGPQITGDSLLGVFSASKGAAHLIVALLVQDGALDLDQRVSHYWPEFAVEGKRDITLRELLSHRAGLVGADTGFSSRSWRMIGLSPLGSAASVRIGVPEPHSDITPS